jgi:hypothetical protein
MAGAWRATALKGVHELRFAFCQTSEGSEGVRCVHWSSAQLHECQLTRRKRCRLHAPETTLWHAAAHSTRTEHCAG